MLSNFSTWWRFISATTQQQQPVVSQFRTGLFGRHGLGQRRHPFFPWRGIGLHPLHNVISNFATQSHVLLWRILN